MNKMTLWTEEKKKSDLGLLLFHFSNKWTSSLGHNVIKHKRKLEKFLFYSSYCCNLCFSYLFETLKFNMCLMSCLSNRYNTQFFFFKFVAKAVFLNAREMSFTYSFQTFQKLSNRNSVYRTRSLQWFQTQLIWLIKVCLNNQVNRIT